MLKKNVIPILYCVVFPLLIGFTLLIIPELYSSVNQDAPMFVRVIRTLMATWLILVYIFTGIPFISNLESSSNTLLKTWRIYYNLLNEKNGLRVDRSFFPAYYFLPKLITCAFSSFVFLGAISTFTEVPLPAKIVVATANFLVLLLPYVVLYDQVLKAVYSNES